MVSCLEGVSADKGVVSWVYAKTTGEKHVTGRYIY